MHLITRSCVLFLWMHTVTFVKSLDCTLEQFINSRLYDSNFDTTGLEASYPGGKQVRVGCNVGYSGFFKLICVEGAWQSRGTKCQPRSCGHPGDAQFADFHLDKGDDFVFGSEVIYTCHKGYQMVSRTNRRRCMAEGWDGVVPICEAKQCPVIHARSNVFANGDLEEATVGNVVRFSCKLNNEILVGSSEIYCEENGEWSNKDPECKEVKCEKPPIENGYVPGDAEEYKEDDVLHFECNPQYTQAEARPSKCKKVGMRAEWSPTPLCEPVKCKLEGRLPAGTRYQPSSRNLFLPGETLKVICGDRYWISERQHISAVSTCKDDGEWSIRPICYEVTCTQYDPLVKEWYSSWNHPVRIGNSLRYSCYPNYKSTNGNNWAKCTRDGWTPKPLCKEITCERKNIPNADIVGEYKPEYKNEDRVHYVCREGYEGEFHQTCTQYGWRGEQYCREITCNIKYYENAEIDGYAQSLYRYNDVVHYTCNRDHEGRFNLTCGKKGWIGTAQCTSVRCERLHIPNAYIIGSAKSSYSHNEQVHYECMNNAASRFTVTCDRRVWTGIQNCTACPIAKVPNGFTIGPYNDKVYYTCKEGYKLSTKGWWAEATCNDGVWSRFEQCIERTKCGEIPAIPNREVTDQQTVYGHNQSVEIICKEGYQATVKNLTCRQGKWRSEDIVFKTICIPIANLCNPPPQVENAVVMTPYKKEYLSNSEVTYECRDGYTMEGERTLQCKDGKWEEKIIKCTPPSQEQ
ncbi:complement factor H-like [Chaetodon auriga]|uniref:complement factor H-like n=1 Tax=Chaetodon auriga TaxID=39042 RepID=UPI0040328E5A